MRAAVHDVQLGQHACSQLNVFHRSWSVVVVSCGGRVVVGCHRRIGWLELAGPVSDVGACVEQTVHKCLVEHYATLATPATTAAALTHGAVALGVHQPCHLQGRRAGWVIQSEPAKRSGPHSSTHSTRAALGHTVVAHRSWPGLFHPRKAQRKGPHHGPLHASIKRTHVPAARRCWPGRRWRARPPG